jgi:hypothetical protein
VAVGDVTAFAEKYVGLIEKENRAAVLGPVERRRRFFSVSPMYLLMTADRSMG